MTNSLCQITLHLFLFMYILNRIWMTQINKYSMCYSSVRLKMVIYLLKSIIKNNIKRVYLITVVFNKVKRITKQLIMCQKLGMWCNALIMIFRILLESKNVNMSKINKIPIILCKRRLAMCNITFKITG